MKYKKRKTTYFDEKYAFQVPRFQLSHVWFVVSIETPRVVARKPVKIFVKCAELCTDTVNRDEVTWLGWMIDDSHKIVPIEFCRA
jgi:hypothetical protein